MGYGGTSWGWLPSPNDVYTSYDYGAAITENRQLTDKYNEFKRQNYFLRAVSPLTKTDAAAPPASSNAALQTAARVNPDTGVCLKARQSGCSGQASRYRTGMAVTLWALRLASR